MTSAISTTSTMSMRTKKDGRKPRVRVTRSEYHNGTQYDIYLYIPAYFEANDEDEKRRIRDAWSGGKLMIPDDYDYSWQVKQLKKCKLFSVYEMSLIIKTTGENSIMIRLRDSRKYTDSIEFLQELFPELEVNVDIKYYSSSFPGRIF